MSAAALSASFVSSLVQRSVVFARWCSILGTLGVCGMAYAGQSATTTSLTVTSGGSVVTSIQSGKSVVLTATVKAGSTTLTNGTVDFCNAAAAHCEDGNLLGTSQITSAGTATLKFFPTPGTHSYSAIFVPQVLYAGSTSSAVGLSVTGGNSVTASLSSSGTVGNYSLTATIQGSISAFPTGLLTFQDASNGNSSLATATVGEYSSTYAPTVTHPTVDQQPQVVAVADFNHDGYPDMVVGNYYSTDMSILLNNQNGTFTTSTFDFNESLTTPASFAIADFNGDGNLDIAVLNSYPYGNDEFVTILLGNGAGGFTEQTTLLPLTSTPENVVTADFNGDGIPDLAVANYGLEVVQFWFGNGDGTFTAQPSLTLPGNPTNVTVGDLNSDGKADLAVSLGISGVGIYLGNGNGTFVAGTTLTGVGYANGAAVGDFNGDGKADLAIANANGSDVPVFLGDGSGGFTQSSDPMVAGTQPNIVAVGDFNGDEIPDLVVADFNGTAPVLLGDGTGNFILAGTPTPTGYYGYWVATGDFNQNGLSDWAAVGYQNNSLTVGLSPVGTTGSATATITGVSLNGAGTVNVDVSYPGDQNYGSKTSSTLGLMGNLTATALTISAAPSAGSYSGQQVMLTATLSPYSNSNSNTNGETVTFYNGGASLGTSTLTSGVATLNTTSLPNGTLTLSAKYLGDTNFEAATATGISYFVAQQAPLSLSYSPSIAIGASTGTITITVTNPSGTAPLSALHINLALPSGLNTVKAAVSQNTCGGEVVTPGSPTNYSPTLSGASVPAAGKCQITFTGIYGSALGAQAFSVASSGSGGFEATTSGSINVLPGVWVANANGTLSEFATDGSVVSPSGGYAGNGNPDTGVAINENGSVYSVSHAGSVLSEFLNSGAAGSDSTAGQAGVSSPTGLAIDGANQIWISNNNGTLSAFYSPITTRTPAGSSSGVTTTTGGVTIDSSGDVWVANTSANSVTEYLGAAVPTQVIAAATAAASEGSRPY